MSLLTMVQNVADETLLFSRPTSIIDNSDESARQSFSFIKKIHRELLEAHDWQLLEKEQSFTTDGSGSYTFASLVADGDFERVKNQTEWDNTNNKKLRIVTPQEWQRIRNSFVNAVGVVRYGRARGDNLLLDPDDSGDTVIFEYISRFTVKDQAGVAKEYFTADTDQSRFKEHLVELGLKAYLKSEYGLPAEEDFDRYYSTMESLMGQEKPQQIIDMNATNKTKFVVNVPDSGVGA